MAEEAQEVQTSQTPVVDDQYDLGDTELYPRSEASTNREAASVGIEPAPPSPTTERPRNADGTFAPKPTTYTHPAFLANQAADFGFTAEEAAAIPTDQLGNTILRLQRQQQAFRAELLRERTIQEGQVRSPEPKQSESAQPAEDDLDLGLDEDRYDPELIGAIKNVHRKSAARIKQLESQLSQVNQREQARVQSEQDRMIDGAFEKLGPAYESTFGKGSISDLAADSGERARRVAVVAAVARAKEGSFAARFDKAVKLLYGAGTQAKPAAEAGEYAEEVAKKNGARITPEEWNKAGLAKPTQRRVDDQPKGEQRAVNNLAQKMRETSEVIPDSEEMEGFLG